MKLGVPPSGTSKGRPSGLAFGSPYAFGEGRAAPRSGAASSPAWQKDFATTLDDSSGSFDTIFFFILIAAAFSP
ncbi:MAG TPA: hypothetical protein VLX68_06985 [Chitinivibrionales bacterium]|nr:hypothetical protein [Chitinivibrionales bacterium]